MKAENNLIAFIIAIRDFLEGIKDVHIESFLADWPSANCITRSVLPHRLPVLSWLSAAVKAADKKPEGIVKMLAGQTLWQRNNQDWAYRAAGLPIYHAPRMPHAMRTETVPLAALYLWRGDNLAQKSIIE